MAIWWAALPLIEKVLWCFAVPATLLAVIQVFLEIFGMGDHHGADGGIDVGGNANTNFDMDHQGGHHVGDVAHHSPLNLFSVKGLIIFFAAFGWLGIAGVRTNLHPVIAILIATAVGAVCMFIFAWVFSTLTKMSEEGNFNIKTTIYKTGKVYLTIPANSLGKGKITIVAQGASRELMAMTDGKELATGTQVQVIDIIDNLTVLVAED